MRKGPLITIVVGSLALVIGVIGVWQMPPASSVNHTWTEIGERLRETPGSGKAAVDPAYAAQQRRFGWGGTAALGAAAIALGINAARKRK